MDRAPIRSGVLFRGGKLDQLTSAGELGVPRSILNLRRGPDPAHLEDVRMLHVPAPDSLENYATEQHRVRRWLVDALRASFAPSTTWPLYVHCTSGKDRTGVFVAVLLRCLGVPDEVIIEEYLLSDGVEQTNIERALRGLEGLSLGEDLLRHIQQRAENYG